MLVPLHRYPPACRNAPRWLQRSKRTTGGRVGPTALDVARPNADQTRCQSSGTKPTIRVVSPAELAAGFHQLWELAPGFGVRTLRQSIERAACDHCPR